MFWLGLLIGMFVGIALIIGFSVVIVGGMADKRLEEFDSLSE